MNEKWKKELIQVAKKAREKAYAVYSNFKVGAALLSEDGQIYTGCNIESKAYAPTICAERLAFAKSQEAGAKRLKAIAIVAEENPCYPCGLCREFMSEFVQADFLLIFEAEGEIKTLEFKDILPYQFSLNRNQTIIKEKLQKASILKNTKNTRDLGSYLNQQSESLKANRLYRSDMFENLNGEDRKIIQELGIACIIDLRRDYERERNQSPQWILDDLNYYHIPIDALSYIKDRREDPQFSLFALYCYLLKEQKREFKRVFQVILQEISQGPIIFHCTAGKDRTGLIAAILLKLAEVDDETIIEDYHLTERLVGVKDEDLADYPGMRNYFKIIRSAGRETMKATLDHFKKEYQGVKSYLKLIGLSSKEIKKLEKILK